MTFYFCLVSVIDWGSSNDTNIASISPYQALYIDIEHNMKTADTTSVYATQRVRVDEKPQGEKKLHSRCVKLKSKGKQKGKKVNTTKTTLNQRS